MTVPEEPVPTVPEPPRRGGKGDVALSAFLALLLATTVLSWPLRDSGAGWLLSWLRLLTLVAGVAAIARHRVHAVAACGAAVVVASAQWASGERDVVVLAARLVFFSLIGAALLARVFGPGRVTVHRVLGAASVYVLLAVLWGHAFQLLVVVGPGAVRGTSGSATLDEAMWMSFITITTTGYGDVLPVSQLARSLAALEAMVGVLYPAILISRLVSLAQGPSSGAGADEPGGS